MDLFYYSGTGNTLHVAREIQKRVSNTKLIPTVSLLDKDKFECKCDSAGILFPINAFSIPRVVEDLLKKADFSKCSYVFALSTRLCAKSVFEKIEGILKKNNSFLNGEFSVETPENYLKVFPIPDEKEIKRMEEKLQRELDGICEKIKDQKDYFQRDKGALRVVSKTLFPIVRFLYNKTNYFNFENKFFVDDKCISCGTCEKICLSGKIILKEGKPFWQKEVECYKCLACINFCPAQAIQNGKKTSDKGRYTNPFITAEDIQTQKENKK